MKRGLKDVAAAILLKISFRSASMKRGLKGSVSPTPAFPGVPLSLNEKRIERLRHMMRSVAVVLAASMKRGLKE